MADDDRQTAWDAFMQRFVPIAQDPEKELGSPHDSWRGTEDRERDWRWDGPKKDNPPWDCSIFDHLDKRARVIRWRIYARPDVQHLIANLAEDGTVRQLVLIYVRAVGAGTISVAYEFGRATPYANSIEPTAGDLPDASVVEELTREIPPRILS